MRALCDRASFQFPLNGKIIDLFIYCFAVQTVFRPEPRNTFQHRFRYLTSALRVCKERCIYCIIFAIDLASYLAKGSFFIAGGAISLPFLGQTPKNHHHHTSYVSFTQQEWLIKFLGDPLEQGTCPPQPLPPSIMQI